ncbi:MAG: hypothetical protein KC933_29610, partial [Myxococcales bacterium]|nr:hypothetical protein [Myxococcales bacterium]
RFQFSIPQQWTCPVGSGLCLDYGNRAFADHVVGRLMASSAVWHHVDLAYGGPIPNLDDPEPVAAVRQMELPPEPAPALVRPVVLVFDVEDRSGRFEGPALDQLSDYLVARLGSTNRFRIVPRAQLQARLRDEKQETYKACYDEACQIEIGKALAAEKTLSTKLLRIGEQCATSVTLSDLRSETTDDSATVRTACGDDAVLDGIDRLVEALVAELSPPVAESAQ